MMRVSEHAGITGKIGEKRKNTMGYTLIELVAAISLIGLVLAGALTVFMLTSSIYTDTGRTAAARSDVAIAMEAVKLQLRFASGYSPADLPGSPAGSGTWIYADGGSVYLFEDGAKQGLAKTEEGRFILSFQRQSDTLLTVTVGITDKRGSLLYQASTKIEGVNLSAPIGSDSGNSISFTP